jgi:predicted nucleic-acid-binding protein
VHVIEDSARNNEPLYLTAIVLCELVWVLVRVSKQTKIQIASHLEQVLATLEFSIEHGPSVRRAVAGWRAGKGDFSDHLIGEISRHAGCRDIVTFDPDLREIAGFTVLR